MRTTHTLTLFVAATLLTGCLRHGNCTDEPDNRFCRDAAVTPRDGGGADASVDAGFDASVGPVDAGADAGPPDGGCGVCEGDTPACNAGACVECTTSETSACAGETSVCNPDSNECVACVTDGDCAGDTPICGTENTCRACGDTECTASGAGVCIPSGACVECSDADSTACGGNPCLADNSCSAYGVGRRACEACDTDDNCQADHDCVPMFLRGVARGGYCLERLDTQCARPFTVEVTEQESLSGVTGQTYCGINQVLTTCEAVRALVDEQTCILEDGGVADGGTSGGCPETGICRTTSGSQKCTISCVGGSECRGLGGAFSACTDGVCDGVDMGT